MGIVLSLREVEHFWAGVRRGGKDECWEWTRGKGDGYGKLSIGGTLVRAHRIAYELATGTIPPGLIVRHTCDNRSCCNPSHLVLGTQWDNMQDAVARGRTNKGKHYGRAGYFPCGSTHPGAKITEDDVRAIRRQRRGGTSPTAIAANYGISIWAVYDILSGRNWGHVADRAEDTG